MKLSEYDKVAKGSGVYLLYNEATSTMKVGMSKCLRQRLQGHSKTLVPWYHGTSIQRCLYSTVVTHER